MSTRLRGRSPWRQHMKANGRPKVAYTEAEAVKLAALNGQKPYLCALCECWHLASRKRSK